MAQRDCAHEKRLVKVPELKRGSPVREGPYIDVWGYTPARTTAEKLTNPGNLGPLGKCYVLEGEREKRGGPKVRRRRLRYKVSLRLRPTPRSLPSFRERCRDVYNFRK